MVHKPHNLVLYRIPAPWRQKSKLRVTLAPYRGLDATPLGCFEVDRKPRLAALPNFSQPMWHPLGIF